MSLSFEPLKPVCVIDDRVNYNQLHTYPVLRSGSNVVKKVYNTQSISASQINFSAPPPSANVFVSREVYFYLPMRLTFKGTPANGNRLLNVGNDAPRQFPIHSAINVMTMTINGVSVSVNSGELVAALTKYGVDNETKNSIFSQTASYSDQYVTYNEGNLSSRNPLGGYHDSPDSIMGRGGVDFVIIQNPVSVGAQVTAIVDLCLCEPLFMLSPLHIGKRYSPAFANVTSMDFNFNFLNGFQHRIWSHNDAGINVPLDSLECVFGGLANGPTSFSSTTGNSPNLQFTYITPQSNVVIRNDIPITYPYSEILRYTTDLPLSVNNAPSEYTSNAIQMNGIPSRIYIYIRERNSDLYTSASKTDTFFRIEKLSVQLLNDNGLLASASMNQLYDISRANGCQMSFTQWSGYTNNSTLSARVGTIGSVIALDFNKDLCTNQFLSPGINNQTMLQFQVTAVNTFGRNCNPTLYVVPLMLGSFTITGAGNAQTNLFPLSQSDVLNCDASNGVSYNDVYDDGYRGGNFFDSLKDFGSKLWSYLPKVNEFLKSTKLASTVLQNIPHPMAVQLGKTAQNLGYGHGGVMAGGAPLSKAQLRKRLAQY